MRNSIEFIAGKDAANLLHVNLRQGQRLLDVIRKSIGKHAYRPITVAEFCKHTGLTSEQVIAFKRSQLPR